ncbi:amidase [Deinococcus sp.]|uniref:amidase n=1 Tax=Deinococcus sp. TaxID=47478 RepID=UPI003CC5BAF8
MSGPDHPNNADDVSGIWAYLPPEALAGQAGGPLSGLRFSAKDLYGVDGWPLHASTRAPLPEVPPSPLVTRLLELGATLVGKTHLHEIALGISGANPYGGTPNPLDARRMSGGSSSGAAASVASGQVDFALGTDTGGSIRIPAAWCGVVGFKPTKDDPLWPSAGVLPLSPTCDHAGPLARDLATILRVQEALSGTPLPAQSWEGRRVGLWQPRDWLDAQADAALSAFAGRVGDLGATLIPVSLPDMRDAYSDIVQSEAASVHRAALALQGPSFMPATLALLRRGAGLSAEAVEAAFKRRAVYRELLDDAMSELDVLLAPAVPCAAPLTGQDAVEWLGEAVPLRVAALRLTVPFSLLGLPVLVLPQPTPDGLSVGVQVVGRRGADAELLGLGLGL